MVEEVPGNDGIWQNYGEHLRLVERKERDRERLSERRGIRVRRRSSRQIFIGHGKVFIAFPPPATAQMRQRCNYMLRARIVELRLATDAEEIRARTCRSRALLWRSTSAAGVVERSSSRWHPCARGRRRLSSLAWAPPVGDCTKTVHGPDSGWLDTRPCWWATQSDKLSSLFFYFISFLISVLQFLFF
jgi:hypothetical protein